MACSLLSTDTYRGLLTTISGELSKENVNHLLFLCEGLLNYTTRESIETPHDFFDALETKQVISHENLVPLKILFKVIGRLDLSRKLPPNDFESDDGEEFIFLCHKIISPFEHLLFKVSEELPNTDVAKLRFAYGEAPRNIEISSALDLFKIMKQQNTLGPEKLNRLISILEAVQRLDLVHMIHDFLCKFADDRMRNCARASGILRDKQAPIVQWNQPDQHATPAAHLADLSIQQNQRDENTGHMPSSERSVLQMSESSFPRSESAPSNIASNEHAFILHGRDVQTRLMETTLQQPSHGSETFVKSIVSTPASMTHEARSVLPGYTSPDHTKSAQGSANTAAAPLQTPSCNPPPLSHRTSASDDYRTAQEFLETPFSSRIPEGVECKPKLQPEPSDNRENVVVNMPPAKRSVSAPSGAAYDSHSSHNEGIVHPVHIDKNVIMSQRSAQVFRAPTNRDDTDGTYKMTANPRGKCLLINNYEFIRPPGLKVQEALQERRGSLKDEENLKTCFAKFNFEVEPFRNLTSSKMEEVLSDYFSMDHSKFDCFVCCILSHGTEDSIYCSDYVQMRIKDIALCFSPKHCPSLAGKPKLFFLSCCLGRTKPEAVSYPLPGRPDNFERDGSEADSAELFSEVADFLFGYATMFGYSSFRDISKGTLYMQALIDIFTEHYREKHVLDLLTMVNQKLSDKTLCIGGQYYKQVGAPQTTLRKQVWF